MSKTVVVNSGDYKIKVSEVNEIILDTGAAGTTRVVGNLLVEGATTTVNTTNLEIEDNIIELNKGESGSLGVTETTSGIRIDRGPGSYEAVQFLYDETIAWNDPQTQTTSQGPQGGGPQGANFGAFKLVSASGDTLALRVGNINNNNAIYFQPAASKTLRVITAGYETNLSDDNDIPNKKYVDDEITAVVLGAAFPRIVEGDTEIKITDNSTSGQTTKVEFKLDNTLYAKWTPDHLEIYNHTTDIGSIRIEDDVISSLNSNQDLELVAPGTGSIRINDAMIINNRPSLLDTAIDPIYDATGIKLYSKTPAGGDTGLYFVNTNDIRGEVISKNRALLFGLIF